MTFKTSFNAVLEEFTKWFTSATSEAQNAFHYVFKCTQRIRGEFDRILKSTNVLSIEKYIHAHTICYTVAFHQPPIFLTCAFLEVGLGNLIL